MSIKLLKSGILTTIQDFGRNGFRHFGINPNGVMDKTAMRLINILLNNREEEAVLEMHFPAAKILFQEEIGFALGGADFSASLNDRAVENWTPLFAKPGNILKFEKKLSGNRIYLAVQGGFKINHWLGSSSTNLTAKTGGFAGRPLQMGDIIHLKLKFETKAPKFNSRISNSIIPCYSKFPTICVIQGAEFDLLTPLGQEALLKENFTVGHQSNRMGFRLVGNPIYLYHPKELVSSAVNFGTIQLLPDGQMVILMADHQTSGGYPRIANVIPNDLPVLSQLGMGDQLTFQIISVEEAERIFLDYEFDLNLLRWACRLRQ